jgi:Double zinc ribbon
MPLAIFGIDSSAINLIITVVILSLVAIWLALIVFTYNDARRRIEDPFLVACSTAASFFPFVGTIVYTILRPQEFLADAREREIEVQNAELQTRHLEARSCRKCHAPVETDFIKCPSCRTRLKQACPSCEKPVGLNWKLCPYCEKTLIEPKRTSRRSSPESGEKSSRGRRRRKEKAEAGKAPATGEAPAPKSPAESEAKTRRSTRKRPSDYKPVRTSETSSDSRPPRSSKTSDSRPARSSRPDREEPAESGPARRRVAVEEERGSKPINSGDSAPPGGDAEPD